MDVKVIPMTGLRMVMVHMNSVKRFYRSVKSDDWSDVSPELAAEMANVSGEVKAHLKSLFAPFGNAIETIKSGKPLAKLTSAIGLFFIVSFF